MVNDFIEQLFYLGDATLFPGCNRYLNIKMGYEIHTLMRDTDDIDSILGDFIEDQVHAFREAIVAGFYLRTLFPKLRVFR